MTRFAAATGSVHNQHIEFKVYSIITSVKSSASHLDKIHNNVAVYEHSHEKSVSNPIHDSQRHGVYLYLILLYLSQLIPILHLCPFLLLSLPISLHPPSQHHSSPRNNQGLQRAASFHSPSSGRVLRPSENQ